MQTGSTTLRARESARCFRTSVVSSVSLSDERGARRQNDEGAIGGSSTPPSDTPTSSLLPYVFSLDSNRDAIDRESFANKAARREKYD